MPEAHPILNSLLLEQTGQNRFRGPSVPSEFRPVVSGVITHTLSFHEPVRATGWLLLAQHSLVAGHGRTYGSGHVFDTGGNQVASFVQENLVCAFRTEPGVRGKTSMAM